MNGSRCALCKPGRLSSIHNSRTRRQHTDAYSSTAVCIITLVCTGILILTSNMHPSNGMLTGVRCIRYMCNCYVTQTYTSY